MAEKNKRWLLMRVDRILVEKMKYIAEYDGRSAKNELELMMKEWVRAFEEVCGEIDPKAPLCKGSCQP